ncbi:MAG TPA: pitrilysin family protein [Gammaproteobacteria bacterium]|nr:pitrilysin family protein [Gammaproteobacteria bacterium]
MKRMRALAKWAGVGAALALLGAVDGASAQPKEQGVQDQAQTALSPPVLLRVPEDPTVSFSVQFRVGSEEDPPGKEGLAFLTGQMLAQAATEANSYEAILEKLYPLASRYDMRVDREATTLTGRTHRDNLDAYLPLFMDAYLRPAFKAQDFERIKNDAINYLENTLRYSSDEELGKAELERFIFEGTPYAHPPEGTVAGLESVTLDDVRNFYRSHYTQANAVVGLGGGFDDALVARLEKSLRELPGGSAQNGGASSESGASARGAASGGAGAAAGAGASGAAPSIEPPPIDGRKVLLIDKPGADASISFGFPIDVLRGERDFYALWIANSWLGEHRNQASHLFQVIREIRGLNYGDYSYIEAFPEGGERSMPPVNVPRHHQIFSVWIRTLPNEHALFALRAAMRELERLVDRGMTKEQFELQRSFLKKYILHFAESTEERLGYAVDDRFYGIDGDGHLARFQRMLDELTVDDVNAALKKHLQYRNVKIAIVTGKAEELANALASDAPSPIEYSNPKPQEVLDEDKEIASYPLGIERDDIRIEPVASAFAKND